VLSNSQDICYTTSELDLIIIIVCFVFDNQHVYYHLPWFHIRVFSHVTCKWLLWRNGSRRL